MPEYPFECDDCQMRFTEFRMMSEAGNPAPPCTRCGGRSQRIYTVPQIVHDLDWQDGKTGDTEFNYALGRPIRSRREFELAKKEVRERTFRDTDGPHTTKTPHRLDPADPDSPVVWENETFSKKGLDIGELHDVSVVPEKLNQPMSAFDEGKTLAETEADLERKLA